MKVNTFIQEKGSHVPIEIELTLVPGLPGIQFLGLPDQAIKESAIRIKTALRHCDFEFPRAHQVIVNLRPNNLKKTSRGLELAVAAAFLWETNQIPPRVLSGNFFVYGELGLYGDIAEPETVNLPEGSHGLEMLTGKPSNSTSPFTRHIALTLKDLQRPTFECLPPAEQWTDPQPERPSQFRNFSFSQSQATSVAVAAVGGHSLLLAGPAGSGKTTVAHAIHEFSEAPSAQELALIRSRHKDHGIKWRPFVKPHHLTPARSLIGGGNHLYEGEMAQAHLGVLVLDEFLEFNSQVQEALREPFEEGKMRIFRSGKALKYDFQAQIIATTNLCPCGDFVPGKKNYSRCRLPLAKCRSYCLRLSGPVLDRFQFLVFSERLEKTGVLGAELLPNVISAQGFRKKRRQELKNSVAPLAQIEGSFAPFVLSELMPSCWPSQRRKVATLRIARTFADLDQSEKVEKEHLNQALVWTLHNFEKLKRWDLEGL